MNTFEHKVQTQQKNIVRELYEKEQEETALRHSDILKPEERQQESGNARFYFAESYRRRFGQLTTIRKPEVTEKPGDAPDKSARQKTKDKYKEQVAERDRQLRVQAYFECQWKEHEDRLNDSELDNDPLNRFAVPELDFTKAEDDSPEEVKRLNWIQTKFVLWENDPQTNSLQRALAGVLTDTRDMLAREMSLGTKNDAKIQAMKTLLTRMMVCVEGLAKNERELHKASNANAADLFRTDDGLDTEGVDAEKLKETAVRMSIDIRRETRQLLSEEIHKLAAFAISARDGVDLLNPGDVAFLEKLGIQKEIFNSFEASDIKVITINEANEAFHATVEELFKDSVFDDAFFDRVETILASTDISDEQRDALISRLTAEISKDKTVVSLNTLADRSEKEREGMAERENSLIELTRKDRAETLIRLRKEAPVAPPEQVKEISGLNGEAAVQMTDVRKALNANCREAHKKYAASIDGTRKELRLAPYLRAIRFAGNAERNDSGNLSDMAKKWGGRVEQEMLVRLRTQLPDGRMANPELLYLSITLFVPEEEMEPFKGVLSLLKANAIIDKDSMPLLLAASDFILTIEDEAVLTAEIEKVSQKSYDAMKSELDGIQRPEDADKAADYLTDLGERLASLRVRAQKTLTVNRFGELNGLLAEKMKSELQDYKELLYGEEVSEAEAPLLDKLLLAGDLHPGIVSALKGLQKEKRAKLLAAAAGADGTLAVAAIDELLVPYPELDEVCLALKSKILKGTLRPGDRWETEPESAFQIQVKHSSVRVVRYLRGKLKSMTKGLREDDYSVETARLYDDISDRQFLEKLLMREVSVDGFWDTRETLMYIRAYALIIAGEMGSTPSIDDLMQQECLQSYGKEIIENAMTAKLDTEDDYQSVISSIEKQTEIYDPTRFGNRALNTIGAIFDYDISDERMAMRSLRGLIEPSGRYEARQLLIHELEQQFGVTGMSSVTAVTGAVIRGNRIRWDNFDLISFERQLVTAGSAASQQAKTGELKAAHTAAQKEKRIPAEKLRQAEESEWGTHKGAARRLSDTREALQGDANGAELGVLITALHIALQKAAVTGATAPEAAWGEIKKIVSMLPSEFDLETMTVGKTTSAEQKKLISEIKDMCEHSEKRNAEDILKNYFEDKTEGDTVIYGLGSLAKAAILMEIAQGTDMKDESSFKKAKLNKLGHIGDEVRDIINGIHSEYASRDKADGDSLLTAEREKRRRKFDKDPDDDSAAEGYKLSMQISGVCTILPQVAKRMGAILDHIGDTSREQLAKDKKEKHGIQGYGTILEYIAKHIDAKTNLLAMTVEENKKNEHAARLTERFKADLTKAAKQIADLERTNPSTFELCLNTVKNLMAFIEELGLDKRADAALDHCPEIFDQSLFMDDAVSASKTTAEATAATRKVQRGLKRTYAAKHKRRIPDQASGAEQLENARVLRGFEPMTGEAAISLTVGAISAILTDSEMDFEEKKKQLTGFRGKISKKTNLLAMTNEEKDAAEGSKTELVRQQFVSLLDKIIDSETPEGYKKNARRLSKLFDYYKLKERADIVIASMAVATKERREADIKSVFGENESKVKDLMAAQYEEAAQNAELTLDVDVKTGIEQIDEERYKEKEMGNDDFYGATFALSILGLVHVLNTAGQTEREKIVEAVKAVRENLPDKFNLLGMLKESVDSADSETARVRELFLSLCDEIIKSENDGEMTTALNKLNTFYIKYNLEQRAASALKEKESKYSLGKALIGSPSFDDRIKDAVGADAGTEELRDTLKQYESIVGTEGRIDAEVSSQIQSSAMKHLLSVTKSNALTMFCKDVVSTDFNIFVAELRKEDGAKRIELTEKLTADIGEAKRRNGKPILDKARSKALAGWLVGELIAEIDKSASANAWLVKNAQRHMSSESRQVTYLRIDQGKEAAGALDAAMKSIAVEDAVSGLKTGEALALNSYTKGGMSVKGKTPANVEVGISLDVAMSNDLMIERTGKADEEKFRVYLSAAFMGRIGASASIDAMGVAHAGVEAGLSGAVAAGVKLDFDSMASCQQFLKGIFSVLEYTEEIEKDGVSKTRDVIEGGQTESREMFKLASDASIVMSTEIGFEIRAKASAEIGLELVTDGLMQISEVKDAAETVQGFFKKTVLPQAEKRVKSAMDDMINGGLLEKLAGFAGENVGELRETLLAQTGEWSKKAVEAIAEKAGEMAEEKIKELATALTEKAILSIKGEEKAKKTPQEDKELFDQVFAVVKGQVESQLTDILTESKTEASAEIEKSGEKAVKEATASKGKALTLIDAEISAGFAGSCETEITRTGDGAKTFKTTAKIGFSAGFQSHLLGADLYKTGIESKMVATLEQHYIGNTLTGAEMSRNYTVGGGASGAAQMRELLEGFGVKNESLIADISNMPEGEMPVAINAKLTQSGLRKYKEAVKEKKPFLANFILADRRNYRIHEILLQANIAESNVGYDVSLTVGTNRLPLTGAKVGVKVAAGTEGKRVRTYVYVPKGSA